MTCWKLLTVFPILRPTSGSFLGPKTRATTPAITTSSGTPSPNKQLQEKPLFLLDLFSYFKFKGLKVLVNKDELEDEKDEVLVDNETGGGLWCKVKAVVAEENAIVIGIYGYRRKMVLVDKVMRWRWCCWCIFCGDETTSLFVYIPIGITLYHLDVLDDLPLVLVCFVSFF